MKINLLSALNDANVDAAQASSQRQLGISISAGAGEMDRDVPLNLCLILDHSGSMAGQPLTAVKQAVEQLLEQLKPDDRISVVAFDDTAKVIVPSQVIEAETDRIKSQIGQLTAGGGTVISAGLQLGIEELSKGSESISQAFLLTDGRGQQSWRFLGWEMGLDDNKRCLELAHQAANASITINTLGFGDDWNQNILENIADAGGGTLTYIQRPDQVVDEFSRLFRRLQSVQLTNAYLLLSLMPQVRLAELKPIAQVAPDVIELPIQQENERFTVRLGDLMKDVPRVILANIYIGKLPEGEQVIANLQVRYDQPMGNQSGMLSQIVPVTANVVRVHHPATNPQVQQYILGLAKYRQTQLAEAKLQQGDRSGAATMLQTAARTALQLGDQGAATVLQTSATRLQSGQELSDADLKKTRIASKTTLQE